MTAGQPPAPRRLTRWERDDEEDPDAVCAGALALIATLVRPTPAEIEQDSRDHEARALLADQEASRLLADFYAETWAIARAQRTEQQ